jgi:hypothetical protein
MDRHAKIRALARVPPARGPHAGCRARGASIPARAPVARRARLGVLRTIVSNRPLLRHTPAPRLERCGARARVSRPAAPARPRWRPRTSLLRGASVLSRMRDLRASGGRRAPARSPPPPRPSTGAARVRRGSRAGAPSPSIDTASWVVSPRVRAPAARRRARFQILRSATTPSRDCSALRDTWDRCRWLPAQRRPPRQSGRGG